MTPTAFLLLAAAVAAVRSRRVPSLIPAARALCALLLFDLYHHACRPALDAWEAGASLSSPEVWALRVDGAIVAGGWCAVVAWLLVSSGVGVATALCGYGLGAVAAAHLWSAAWMPLLIAPRFAVGALAWYVSIGPARRVASRPPSQRCPISRRPSLLIGQIITACQVGAAAFLWSRWGDVRLLSSVCWVACAVVAWRAE